MKHDDILIAIRQERVRQEELRAAGTFSDTAASPRISHDRCLAILTEEIGECARVLNDIPGDGLREKLREELIQVAAVAVAWVEKIDAEKLAAERVAGRTHGGTSSVQRQMLREMHPGAEF